MQALCYDAPIGIAMLKSSILLIPLLCILSGYWVYSKKFTIDERFYHGIVRDLEQRGDITPT